MAIERARTCTMTGSERLVLERWTVRRRSRIPGLAVVETTIRVTDLLDADNDGVVRFRRRRRSDQPVPAAGLRARVGR